MSKVATLHVTEIEIMERSVNKNNRDGSEIELRKKRPVKYHRGNLDWKELNYNWPFADFFEIRNKDIE